MVQQTNQSTFEGSFSVRYFLDFSVELEFLITNLTVMGLESSQGQSHHKGKQRARKRKMHEPLMQPALSPRVP
jgi:hypothetical protein